MGASGRGRIVWIVLLGGWCAATWWLSSKSDPRETLGIGLDLPDWLFHAIEYAAGGFLAMGALGGGPAMRSAAIAVGFCVAWGLLDEWHQGWVPGRESSGADVLADSVGGTLGTLVYVVLGRPGPPDEL